MKVLVSAYSCSPNDGSEPAIGWNWAQCIAANGHEVVVITRSVNRRRLDEYIQNHPTEPMRIVFHDLAPVLQSIYKLPFGNYTYYVLWQATAAQLALKLHRTEKFDRVHHVTWASFRVPSFMGRLGIPFIFGPVGGGEDTPPKLRKGLGPRGQLWDSLRRLSSALMMPLMSHTYGSAEQIVATTEETRVRIPAKYRSKVLVQRCIGIEPEPLLQYNPSRRKDPAASGSRLELLFVGRLLAWKGVHLVLRALALLEADRDHVHLTIIGSGNDGNRLKKLCHSLRIEDKVTWVPWMPREELIRRYTEFDILTFTSMHDSGGLVMIEAMTFGLPVVCLDLGGPALVVNNNCGRVISTKGASEEQVVRAIATCLRELVADRGLVMRLSEAAQARAAELTWRANVDAVYGESLVTQGR